MQNKYVSLKPKNKRKGGFEFNERLTLASAALNTVEIKSSDTVLCVSQTAGALESKVLRAAGCYVHSAGRLRGKYGRAFDASGRAVHFGAFIPERFGEYDFIILFDTAGALAEKGLLECLQAKLVQDGILFIADGAAAYNSDYYGKILTELKIENAYDGKLTVLTARREKTRI
ncbi:MAG: hypothetical protein LBC13_02070 [Clostridiales bacterium]|jgi:hypothetical protein|nr:hypothetical protein [Clostridiales bacterium]